MNYKMLFQVSLVMATSVSAWFSDQSFSHSFSLDKNDTAVVITVDTLKKVTAEDINIIHRNNHVAVNIKGLDHTVRLGLDATKHSFGVSLCSEKVASQGDEKNIADTQQVREYASFHGSSCMQQVISAAVNLEEITAEYEGTQLILSIPLIEPVKSKKIPVVVKPEPKKEMTKKNKKIASEVHDK